MVQSDRRCGVGNGLPAVRIDPVDKSAWQENCARGRDGDRTKLLQVLLSDRWHSSTLFARRTSVRYDQIHFALHTVLVLAFGVVGNFLSLATAVEHGHHISALSRCKLPEFVLNGVRPLVWFIRGELATDSMSESIYDAVPTEVDVGQCRLLPLPVGVNLGLCVFERLIHRREIGFGLRVDLLLTKPEL